MKRLVLVAVLAVFAAPALAEECTEAKSQSLAEEMLTLLDANPDSADSLERYVAEVEAEYGGEPSEAQTCEALRKLMAKITAGE